MGANFFEAAREIEGRLAPERATPLAYGLRDDGFALFLGGWANMFAVPGLAFAAASFFGFLASRFDLCCTLAMAASFMSDPCICNGSAGRSQDETAPLGRHRHPERFSMYSTRAPSSMPSGRSR